jgi:hypothetical protein
MPIGLNLAKAQEIHKDNIRAARQPLLEKLDVEFVRTLEKAADTAPIAEQKQALRDATAAPEIAAAQSAEDLKAAWDADLLGPSPY